MNLSPEEREAGKENFQAAIQREKLSGSDLDRREFLKGGILAGAVAGGSLGAFYFGYEAAVADPVRVGVIGTGDEGSVLIGAINPDYLQVVSIADIRPYNVHRAFHGDLYSPAAEAARPGLLKKYGWQSEDEARRHVKVYGPYQELIENARADGIEAVIIALPLHLHAPAAIVAMRAGLHVLTEKLMGHSVHECKEMARVAKETHRYLATGHQRHYNILYQQAVDQIKRGLLGDIHYIRAQWHRGNLPGSDSWQQPMPQEAKPDDPQADKLVKQLASWRRALSQARGTEIDTWRRKVAQVEAQIADVILSRKPDGEKDTLAEQYGYLTEKFQVPGGKEYHRPAIEELIRWRLWDRTGGGLMAELGSHQLDAASIFISATREGGQKVYPLNVAAAANRPCFPADRDVNDHVYCMFEFPAHDYKAKDPIASQRKIGVQYASVNGNGFGGYGEIVFGTKGTLILEREQEAMLLLKESESKLKVDAGPALDTQASGPAQVATKGPAVQVSRGYKEEEEHWAWCIRQDPDNRDPEIQPRCHPKVALGDAVIALTTNAAAQKGQRLNFEPAWFDPDDDATPEGIKPDLDRKEYTL